MIIAAAVGNVIEWYDFYIFGSLAAVLAVKFFDKTHPVAALLSTIALFTAGFLIRPLGAFLFGWMGDRVGRKYTFLVTLSGMGLGTGAIGLIPTIELDRFDRRVHPVRPAHDPGPVPGRRVWRRHHLRRRARAGRTPRLLHRLAADLADARHRGVAGRDHRTRTYFGEIVFNEWAWRVPFLVSFLLVAIAIYIRLQLQETPIFEEIKAKGADDQEPLEGGLPQLEYQIRADRHRRADRARRGLVQRSVLGAVLPAAGFQGGPADLGLHRGSRAAHCNAELDLLWLAVRP